MTIIPIRPEDDDKYRMPNVDKDCLAYYVLMGKTTTEAFARFHPEYADPVTGRLRNNAKEPCRQFFSFAVHKEYIASYKATLEKFASGTHKKNTNVDVSEDKKERAIKNFTNKVYEALDNANADKIEELKDAADLGKTVKIFKEEESIIEPPRRYLPEMCYTSCRYRLFCEQLEKSEDIIDACQYCKALSYAKDNGFVYEPTNLLDIPKELLELPIEEYENNEEAK